MVPSLKLGDMPIGFLDVETDDGRSGYVMTASMDTIKVGRRNGCDIQIEHSSMSREHFAISVVSRTDPNGNDGTYGFVLDDLSSFNKTKLNGEEIEKGALKSGDLIEAGHARFRFHSLTHA
jgi:pSer/pThr/pTyr-binding forkhead associated (FHA) protein